MISSVYESGGTPTQCMTRDFYDAEDATYREFWEPDGSLHWGFFEDDNTGFIEVRRSFGIAALGRRR